MTHITDTEGRLLGVGLGLNLEAVREDAFAVLARHGRIYGDVRLEIPNPRSATGVTPVTDATLWGCTVAVRGRRGALLGELLPPSRYADLMPEKA